MQTIEIRTTQNVTIEYELAGLRDRMLAYLIDFLIVSALYFLLVLFISFLFPTTLESSHFGMMFLLVFLPLAGFIFYQLFSEIFNAGQSWGKKAIGIKVVRIDGQEPGLSDYLLRAIFLIIDVMMSFGTVAMILISSSPKRQRLGDLTANTTVIKSKETLRFKLEDILKINTIENYEPKFPEVKNLSEEDMLLIKNTISRYNKYKNPAHAQAIKELVAHLKNVLELDDIGSNKVEFLKTLIRDYIVLTR